MTEEFVLKLGRDAIETTALLSAPILIAALITGIVVSLFQAITQINEATLTFIPKMIVAGLIVLFAGSWMIDVMSRYTINLIESVPEYVRE